MGTDLRALSQGPAEDEEEIELAGRRSDPGSDGVRDLSALGVERSAAETQRLEIVSLGRA